MNVENEGEGEVKDNLKFSGYKDRTTLPLFGIIILEEEPVWWEKMTTSALNMLIVRGLWTEVSVVSEKSVVRV